MGSRGSIEINTKVQDTRQLIHSLFRVQADFRSFLCDYLPHLQNDIPEKICYTEQVTMLLDRVPCNTILQAIRSAVDFLMDEHRLNEERHSDLCDQIQRISEFSEPKMKIWSFGRPKRSKRLSHFSRWILGTFGIIWLYEKARWMWSKIKGIRIEGGTIVIAGFAGGGLYLSIHSCRYEAGHQTSLPDRSMFPSTLVAAQSRSVNFCVRQIMILQEDEPMLPLPPNAIDSKQIQQSQQLLYHINNLLNMYAPMELPHSSNKASHLGTSSLLDPSFGRYGSLYNTRQTQVSHEPAIISCTSSQTNRLAIDLALKWKKKAEIAVRSCLANQNCNDSKMLTVSCEFSYAIANQNNEYVCPNQSFSILSSGISYIQAQNVINQHSNPSYGDMDFSSLLSHCSSALSAITLLAACHHR